MPTYEYECGACGLVFEHFQSMTEAPIRKCPKCRKLKVKRLIGTGAGLIFKGSGFYITDYRSDSYKQGKKSDTGSAGAVSAPPPSTSGSAPAKKETASA
jgi:putative FmdB family regulatory protein